MPEITSAEAMRTKLREFEERVDGVIAAAKAISRIKTDAENLLKASEDVKTKSEQSLQKAEAYRAELQQMHLDWDTLRKEFEKIEASTRSNAEQVANSKSLVEELAEKVRKLLEAAKGELRNEVHAEILRAEQSLESKFQKDEGELEERLNRRLAQHQQAVDKQLTDFLNKQNALVQNLTQQIDGLHRVAETISAEFIQTKTKVDELAKSIQENSAKTDAEIHAIVEGVNAISAFATQLQTTSEAHDQALSIINADVQKMTARLEQATGKLRGSMIGRLAGFK